MDRTQIMMVVGALLMLLVGMQLSSGSTRPPAPGTSGAPSGSAPAPAPGGTSSSSGPGEVAPAPVPSLAPPVQRELIQTELSNGLVRLGVTNEGGRLRSVELSEFEDRKGKDAGPVQLVTVPEQGELLGSYGPDLALASRPDVRWEVLPSSDARSVSHRIENGGVEVVRSLALDREGYGGRLLLRVANRSS